jgi:acyl-CoA synthetase
MCIAIIGSVQAEDLLLHLAREGVSKYDLPEYFLRLESFPLTPSGKILKRDLVAMVKRGELRPAALHPAMRQERVS